MVQSAMTLRHAFARAVTPFGQLFARQPLPDASYTEVKTEEDYELDANQGDAPSYPRRRYPRGTSQPLLQQSGRRILLVTLGVLALLVVLANYCFPGQKGPVHVAYRKDHKLYLLIPSSRDPDIGFCRTELTAAVLGYPTPQMLDREVSGRSEVNSAIDQIRLTSEHLNGMGRDRDNDLVILLGSPHHWFQLRPEVLMKRYYEIIQRADEKLKKQTGEDKPPTHRIVFAAQNHCSGHTLDELACFAPPKSPMGKASTLRFLDSSLAIGTVRDLRRLFSRVNGKAIARRGEEMTQQTILAEIFGEQAFRRKYVQQGSWSSKKRKMESALRALGYSKSSITEAIPGRQLLENPEKAEYEMGITLDYGNELGLSVTRRADLESVDWLRYSQSPSTLPAEIKRSRPPFWTTTSSYDLPLDNTWSDIPLLTSKRTDGVPAIIHVAADQQADSKAGLDWRTLWLHSHAKQLWEAQNDVSRVPLMSVVEGKTEHIFWNQELRMDRDGANWLEGGWKSWSDHCGWSARGEVVKV